MRTIHRCNKCRIISVIIAKKLCKKCYTNQWYKKYPLYNKLYYKKNRVKRVAQGKLYYRKNIDKIQARNKKNRKHLSEQHKLYIRKRVKNDPVFVHNRRVARRAYEKKRKETDPVFSFRRRIKSLLYLSFRRNKYKKEMGTLLYLGYSKEELYEKLSSYISKSCVCCRSKKITLKNSHIDHIIPICSARSKKDIVKLNQLTNLRLICKECNIAKMAQDFKFKKKKTNKKEPPRKQSQ